MSEKTLRGQCFEGLNPLEAVIFKQQSHLSLIFLSSFSGYNPLSPKVIGHKF